MAETSRLRDLALEETTREFVRQVPDMDALNMLYLLTYADTTAVGEGVWTEVKGRFLSELYGRAEALLAAPSCRRRRAAACLCPGPQASARAHPQGIGPA